MKEQIEQALHVLIGKPLWDSGRAGLQWFAFGSKHIVPDIRLGKVVGTKEVGDYALLDPSTEEPHFVVTGEGIES